MLSMDVITCWCIAMKENACANAFPCDSERSDDSIYTELISVRDARERRTKINFPPGRSERIQKIYIYYFCSLVKSMFEMEAKRQMTFFQTNRIRDPVCIER